MNLECPLWRRCYLHPRWYFFPLLWLPAQCPRFLWKSGQRCWPRDSRLHRPLLTCGRIQPLQSGFALRPARICILHNPVLRVSEFWGKDQTPEYWMSLSCVHCVILVLKLGRAMQKIWDYRKDHDDNMMFTVKLYMDKRKSRPAN